jgi:hypothetical protein
MKNLKSYLIATFIAGNLPSAICSTGQPSPDQAAHPQQEIYGDSPPFRQMIPGNQGLLDPTNPYHGQVPGSSAHLPQISHQGQQGFSQGLHRRFLGSPQGFSNMPFQQGTPQNSNPFGNSAAYFKLAADQGVTPNAGAFPNIPSHQGIPPNPNPHSGPGVTPNAGAFPNIPFHQGFPPNLYNDPVAYFKLSADQGVTSNAGAFPNTSFHQGVPQNPNSFSGQGANFNPNAGMLQQTSLNPNFTAVLGKLDVACQTNFRIGASLLATLPPPDKVGERTQATLQIIQGFVGSLGLPDSVVATLEVTDYRPFYRQKFSQLQLIDSLTHGSKEILSAGTFSDNNIVNFLNGSTGTSRWQAGLWQQLWRTRILQFFVIYNNEIYVVFPTSEQNHSLFATNSEKGMGAVARGVKATKAAADMYNKQRSWLSRAADTAMFWRGTPTHQKVKNWADIAAAFSGAFPQQN